MLKTRVLAAAVFAPALLALVWVGGAPLAVACFVLAMLMLWEFLRLQFANGGERYPALTAYGLGAGATAAVLGWLPIAIAEVFAPAALLWVLTAVLLRPEPIERSVSRVSTVLMGVLYAACLLPFLARLRQLEDGLGLALMALFCTWGADTGAYFAGRFLGKTQLYPKISPKKTVEGAVGGLVAAVAVAFIVRWVASASISVAHTAVLGVLAAVFGTIGDLCESMIKRAVGAKDSSGLIPGHGGVMDRFDAVSFVAPVFYIYLLAVGST